MKKPSDPSLVGEIPKEDWSQVFFEHPLQVASEGGPLALPRARAAETGVGANPGNPATKVERSGPDTPARSGDWASLISGEDLADEVKAVKASLGDKLQSIGKYNGNYKDVKYDAATLAVLATIAIEHPDAPGWKPLARYVRDVSAEIARSAVGLGEKSYKPARAAWDKLDALLAGSKPPGLEETTDTRPISEVVKRGPLMYRMERAFNWMKLTVNTEAAFKKEGAKVRHEGAVLAALARAIADKGYSDADIDEYGAYSRQLSQSGLEVIEAAKDGSFRAYTQALDKGGKACAECHLNFKNN